MVSNSKPDAPTLGFNRTDYAYSNRNNLKKVITYNNDNTRNYTQYYYDAAGSELRMYTGLSAELTINGLDIVTEGQRQQQNIHK